jgi:PBSX family phage portal protein
LDEPEIEVTLDQIEKDSTKSYIDPFSISPDEFFKVYGKTMGKNAVRRAKYASTKYDSGLEGSGSKQIYTNISAYDLLEATVPPHDILSLAQLYDKSSWNYAAINAKAANVIGLGYNLVPSPMMNYKLQKVSGKKKLSDTRNKLELKRLELEMWIDSLNNSYTFSQTLTNSYIDYQATGNGYIEIGRISVGPKKGLIGYIGHIPSSTMRVRRFHDGFVQMVEGRVRFFRNYGDDSTPDPLGLDQSPNEIIHLKNYSPTNTYYGVPDIIASMNAVAGDEFAQRYNLDLFEHKAAPRYVIIAKGANLSDRAQARILEFLQSGLKGKNHRSIYIPLPADRDGNKTEFRFEPVETSIQDSSFDNYRKSNRDEILAVHRVPASKLGIIESSSAAASAIDQDKTFKEVVCRPEQSVLEKRINCIISEVQDVFVLKFNELTLTDALAQSRIDDTYLKYGVSLPNEVRADSLKKGPIESGDTKFEMTRKQLTDNSANSLKNRERDTQRSLTASDSVGDARNPKGQGQKV